MECELLMRLHRTARYLNTQGLGFLTSFPNSLRTVFLPFWVLVFMHALTGSRAQVKGQFKQKKCENLFALFRSAHTMVQFAQQQKCQNPLYVLQKNRLIQVCKKVPKSKDEMLFLKAFRGLKCCQQRHRTLKMSQREGHTNKTDLKSKVMLQFGQHKTQ